jgi:hypothetical protein
MFGSLEFSPSCSQVLKCSLHMGLIGPRRSQVQGGHSHHHQNGISQCFHEVRSIQPG